MSDWISFYDFKHSVIYVNARHRDVHYRTIAEDIRRYVSARAAAVLDYGCGEATSAGLVADAADHLTLVEAAPNVRAALSQRYAANPKISVRTPDAAAALPAASFDLIVMHSVAQYLSAAELARLLTMFRRLVKPDGLVIIGDVVPPHLADYLRLKKTAGLSHYTEAAMLEKLKSTGFKAERAPRNIGHNQRRMTFLARTR
jgi:SAM-dependent methyltransferase